MLAATVSYLHSPRPPSQAYSQDAYLSGNQPYTGGAENLPPPPPLCYPRSKTTPPAGAPPSAPMGQNQLDNWSRWPGSSGPSSPLDNRSAVGSPASWQEQGGVGHSSPAHRTEEIQYGMTGQQPQGQTRGRSYSSSSSSGGLLSSPLQVHHYQNHHAASVAAASSQALPRKSSSAWASPPQPQHQLGHSSRTQQALSDWYYNQNPERSGRSMQTRHRSYSQDRLSDTRRQQHQLQQQRTGGWPHSASQDTLLLLQQSGPGPQGEPYWSYGDWDGGSARGQHGNNYTRTRSENLLAQFDRHGRSLEMLDRAGGLVSPRFERPAWLQQAPQPPPRTEAYSRQGGQFASAQPAPMTRQTHAKQHQEPHVQAHPQPKALQTAPPRGRLPPSQSVDEQPVGYRSYSPSFYRKTGRIMQQAQSFRDPSYSGPHLNWNPNPKSPPEGSAPLTASASASPETPERAYRPTNHERERGSAEAEVAAQTQEVVLRQKPPTGRRNAYGLRHPHYPLPVDGLEPPVFSPEPQDSTASAGPAGDGLHRKASSGLAPLPIEDDSLASIPFIGKHLPSVTPNYMITTVCARVSNYLFDSSNVRTFVCLWRRWATTAFPTTFQSASLIHVPQLPDPPPAL